MPDPPAVPLPIRTAVRVATERDVRAANERAGWEGARAFEPAPKAIHRMRNVHYATRPRLLSWATHPDERVVVELLRRENDFNLRLEVAEDGSTPDTDRLGRDDLERDVHRPVAEWLSKQAVARARDEGVWWTPVLDQLYENQSTHNLRTMRKVGDRWENRPFYTHVPFCQRAIDKLAARADRAHPAQLYRLLGYEGRRFEAAMRKRFRRADPDLCRRLATIGHREYLLTHEGWTDGAFEVVMGYLTTHHAGWLTDRLADPDRPWPDRLRPRHLRGLLDHESAAVRQQALLWMGERKGARDEPSLARDPRPRTR